MDPDFKWIVVEVDGKTAAVSPDFRLFAEIAGTIAGQKVDSVSEIKCRKASMQEVVDLSKSLKWEDLAPFGTRFQKHVWHTLFNLTHPEPVASAETPSAETPSAATPDGSGNPYSHLLSYTDFARLCGNEPGTRAVAHAVALNPIAVIIPCHLIVPKETIDRIRRIEEQVTPTLFSNFLLATASLDFGAYRYGPDLKRQLITAF